SVNYAAKNLGSYRRQFGSRHRRRVRVLDLDPMRRPASAVGAVAMLRHQAFQSELAGLAEQVRPDLPLLEWRHENSVGAACQQAREIGLAHRQRQLAQILAVNHQAIEGVELHLVVALWRECSPSKSDTPSTPEQHRLAVEHERGCAIA